MTYTLQDGGNVCARIEESLSTIGLHAAIGGSLAYRGNSTKDIDIILYPHNRDVKVDRFAVVELLGGLGYRPKSGDDIRESTSVPDVFCAVDGNNRRVDFFFMQRGDFFPEEPGPTLEDLIK